MTESRAQYTERLEKLYRDSGLPMNPKIRNLTKKLKKEHQIARQLSNERKLLNRVGKFIPRPTTHRLRFNRLQERNLGKWRKGIDLPKFLSNEKKKTRHRRLKSKSNRSSSNRSSSNRSSSNRSSSNRSSSNRSSSNRSSSHKKKN